MTSVFYEFTDDGQCRHLLPEYQYVDLNHDQQETRFLILHPSDNDERVTEDHVRCTFETQLLAHEEPAPFTAVFNARGYREIRACIEVDGKMLLVPIALQTFLRYYRQSHGPVRLWIRQVCLNELDDQERTRYCTRQYVDSIYDRAKSLVDMSEFVSDLVDRDIVPDEEEPVAFFSGWHQIWNETTKMFGTPDLYPVKLGKKQSFENPVDIYEYIPLDMVAGEIRVLSIQGSKDPAAPIVTSLAHFPFYCGLTYSVALHMLKTDSETEDIVVTGLKMTVQKSLADLIRSIRQETAMVVWMEAICVDQNNFVEIDRQLRRKADIIKQAKTVVLCVDFPDDGSNYDTEFHERIQDLLKKQGHYGDWTCGESIRKFSEGRLWLSARVFLSCSGPSLLV